MAQSVGHPARDQRQLPGHPTEAGAPDPAGAAAHAGQGAPQDGEAQGRHAPLVSSKKKCVYTAVNYLGNKIYEKGRR